MKFSIDWDWKDESMLKIRMTCIMDNCILFCPSFLFFMDVMTDQMLFDMALTAWCFFIFIKLTYWYAFDKYLGLKSVMIDSSFSLSAFTNYLYSIRHTCVTSFCQYQSMFKQDQNYDDTNTNILYIDPFQ